MMQESPEHPDNLQHIESDLQVQLDDDLCAYCALAFQSILTLKGDLGPPPLHATERLPFGNARGDPYVLRHHDGTLRTLRYSSNTCRTCRVIERYITDQIECHNSRWSSLYDGHYRMTFEPGFNSAIEVLIRVAPNAPPPLGSEQDWPSRQFPYYLYLQEAGKDPYWIPHGRSQCRPKSVVWPILETKFNSHTSSKESFNWAKDRLQECRTQDYHPRCIRDVPELPKRIIDLGANVLPKLLYLQDGNSRAEDYVTLSYSWGSSPPLRTTGENIMHHFEGIPFSKLPQTLKDAALITLQLGYRYIWIDALCIVQDDKEDWAEHGPLMATIYNASALTISATSSADCDSGIFSQITNHGIRVGEFVHQTDMRYRRSLFFDRPRYFSIKSHHLFTRGWTLQEQLVSPRALHYTDEGIAWTCFNHYFDQHHNCTTDTDSTVWAQQNALYKSIADPQAQNTFEWVVNKRAAYHNWYTWIRDFSDRNLTYLSDKLPAMAGIAAHFSANMQTTYLAGLWKENFVSDLLWEREDASLSVHRHSGVAPSWSWASVSGRLRYDLAHYLPAGARYDICIWNVDVYEKVLGSYGQVNDGYITADGWMQEIRAVRLSFLEFGMSPEYSAESGIVKGTNVVCKLDKFEEDDIKATWCWALRIGLFVPLHESSDSVPRIAMLLLEKVGPIENTYRRIGVAYTLPTYQGGGPLPEDICTSGVWQRVVIV